MSVIFVQDNRPEQYIKGKTFIGLLKVYCGVKILIKMQLEMIEYNVIMFFFFNKFNK